MFDKLDELLMYLSPGQLVLLVLSFVIFICTLILYFG